MTLDELQKKREALGVDVVRPMKVRNSWKKSK